MKLPFAHYRVTGKSMEPTLHEGDSVLVFRWFKGRLGDVVVAKQHAKTIIKRIARIENGRIHLKGDNGRESSDSDQMGTIERRQVIGKVVYTKPISIVKLHRDGVQR